jgi:hypothetical protein
MMAFTYLQHRRLASQLPAGKKTKANAPGPPPQPTLPAVRRAILAVLRPIICLWCPNCGAPINIHQRE